MATADQTTLENLRRDADDIAAIAGGTADQNGTGLVPTRLNGNALPTLAKLQADYFGQTYADEATLLAAPVSPDGRTALAIAEKSAWQAQGGAWVNIGNVATGDDLSGLPAREFIRTRKTDVRPASGERSALVVSARALAGARAGWNNSSSVYCDPNAAGAGDGTSWADAFTTMAAAFAALQEGGRLYTNAPSAAPFTPQTVSSIPDFVEWVSDNGPDGATWIDGRIYADWTNVGGIWAAPSSEEPPFVVFNLSQDTIDGAVTGVDLTKPKVAAAIKRSGYAAADMAAWYGFLARSASATINPAEGEWSWVAGMVYINPPGTPAKADVDAKAAWTNGANAIQLGGADYRGLFHHGDLRTFCTASTEDATGYGIRMVAARDCTIADHTAYLCGYHALGAAGGSQGGNTFVRCRAIGAVATDSGSGGGVANPYVFFTSDKDYADANQRGLDLFFLAFPELDTAGAPLTDVYSPVLGLSHTAGTTTMGGIRWQFCTQVDFIAAIEAKHALSIAYNFGAFSGTDFDAPDIADAGVWPVSAWDCTALGVAAAPTRNGEFRNCTFDRMGHGTAADIPLNMAAPVGADTNAVRMIGGSFDAGRVLAIFASQNANDAVRLEGVDIRLAATGARPTLFRCAQATTTIEMQGCSVDSDDPAAAIISANPTAWGADGANMPALFASDGGNLFGSGITLGAHHTNTNVTPLTIDAFLGLVDPSGRDAAGVSL